MGLFLPKQITKEYHNQTRNQWHHVIDIAPTILEAVGIKPPSKVNGVEQRPYEGKVGEEKVEEVENEEGNLQLDSDNYRFSSLHLLIVSQTLRFTPSPSTMPFTYIPTRCSHGLQFL